MDDFDISGYLLGEDLNDELNNFPLMADGSDEEEHNPFDPDEIPKKVTNNLDLTGIAYDFPEDAQNSGGASVELGNDQISAALDVPSPAMTDNETDGNPPEEENYEMEIEEDELREISGQLANPDVPSPAITEYEADGNPSLEENDEIEIDEDQLPEIYGQLTSIDDFLEVPQEPVDHWPEGVTAESLLAMNEAYTELINRLTNKVDLALADNREKQVAHRIQALRDASQENEKKVPVLLDLPPYFKDENMMEEKNPRFTDYDPLMNEEKEWLNSEIQQLIETVKAAMIALYMEPYLLRKKELEDFIITAGQDVTKSQIAMWKDEHEGLVRKNSCVNEMTFETLMAAVDQKQIDWTTISNINFNGMRTAQALEHKWLNEISPRWSQEPWTDEEIKKLKKLREEDKFVSWALLADRMGTRRTPWQCFSKYMKDSYQQTKEWTQEEDEKLIALCCMMQMNGNINWDKVTDYMPGRNRQQVRVRYMRTLDKNVKRGKRVSEQECLLWVNRTLNRLGAQEWSKKKAVAGRTDTQCRERGVNVLDRRVHPKEWTLEEDEKLLFLVSFFGHNAWLQCASFLHSRSGDQCRDRHQSLMDSKIELCMAKSISAKDTSIAEYKRHKEGLGADQAEILNAVQITQCDLDNCLKRKERQKVPNNSDSRSATPGCSRPKIDVTGLPPPHFIQEESAPGPSSTTPVNMTTFDTPTRKHRSSKKDLAGTSTEEKPLEATDNDDMVTPFRPTTGVRRLSSFEAGLPTKKMRKK